MKRTIVLFGIVSLVLGLCSVSLAETIDGSIFSDDFNGSTLDGQWTQGLGSPPAPTVSGGYLSISTAMSDNLWVVTTDPVDFSSSPNDWWAEIKYSFSGTAGRAGYREWVILAGSSSEHATNIYGYPLNHLSGFSLRAYDSTSSSGEYILGWWGHDGDGTDHRDDLQTGMLDGQEYVVAMHRKTDETVDIYLDGSLIANRAIIYDSNPTRLFMGEASSYCGGTQLTDYIRVGQPVPEPSALALLACGLIGLLAYAWRKRK